MRMANFQRFSVKPGVGQSMEVSFPSSSTAVKYGPCLLILKKGSSVWGNFCISSTWSARPMTNGEKDQLPSGSQDQDLFWQLSRDGNLHGLACHTPCQPLPIPSSMAPWRMNDTVVTRGNAGWTTSKSGHPCPCQNHSQGPPAENLEEDFSWIAPHVTPMTQSVKGLNWTELKVRIQLYLLRLLPGILPFWFLAFWFIQLHVFPLTLGFAQTPYLW